MTTLVRAASLTHYLDVARRCGLDPWRLARAAGVPAKAFEEPDLRISVDAVRELLQQSAAQSDEPAFALLMAEERRVSNLGVLGMLMREEPTVRHALQSIMAYGRTHNEALFQRIEEARGLAVVHADLLFNSPGPANQAIELVVAVALRTVRFFVGADWRPRRICFTHAAPRDLSTHRRVLGRSPEFRADFNGFVCSSADLDTPIASADPVVARYIRQQLQSRQRATLTVADEVRQIVLVLLPRGRCTVDQVAQLMGIHRRTLHRHLAAEGLVFSGLVLTVRRELALRYLAEGSRSLGEISHLLGFADLSSFSRWHRQQFGRVASAR